MPIANRPVLFSKNGPKKQFFLSGLSTATSRGQAPCYFNMPGPGREHSLGRIDGMVAFHSGTRLGTARTRTRGGGDDSLGYNSAVLLAHKEATVHHFEDMVR